MVITSAQNYPTLFIKGNLYGPPATKNFDHYAII
jgi:hypothetical protein